MTQKNEQQKQFTEKVLNDTFISWATRRAIEMLPPLLGKRIHYSNEWKDLTQEVWCILLKARDTYESKKSSPTTYAVKVVYHYFLGYACKGLIRIPRDVPRLEKNRIKARRARVPQFPNFHRVTSVENSGFVENNWDHVDYELCKDKVKELLCKVMAILKPRQAEIYLMRVNGSTLKEIGEEFSITKERVRQILMNCEKKMRASKEFDRLQESV